MHACMYMHTLTRTCRILRGKPCAGARYSSSDLCSDMKLFGTVSQTSPACLVTCLFQMPHLGPLSAHITVGPAPMTAQTWAVMCLSDLGRCPGMQSLWLSDEVLVIPRRVLSSEDYTLAFGI